MLLTVRDVARTLNCSTGCVYRLIACRRLPHVRIGVGRGTIRIDERDVEDFLRQQLLPDRAVLPPRIDLRQFAG